MLAQLSRIWLSGTREPVIGTLKYDAIRKLWKTLSARMLLITDNALTARIGKVRVSSRPCAPHGPHLDRPQEPHPS